MSYKDDVLAVFDHLHDVSWPVFIGKIDPDTGKLLRDFWHTANTLDTCIDFVIQGSGTWGSDAEFSKRCRKIPWMIQASKDFFDRVYCEQNGLDDNGSDKRSPNVWWDDYGWWGITFTKIYQHYGDIVQATGPLPVTAKDCLEIARKSWGALGSYSLWVNNIFLPPNAPKRGPVNGGSWNHTPNLQVDDFGGIQNTVTNALFLVLSTRLFQNTQDRAFLNAAAVQYLFFRNWFVKYLPTHCPNSGPQQGLFRCLLKTDGGGKLIVVHERAIDPNNEHYNRGEPGFFDGQLWTGDQGLLLGGLAAVLDSKQAMGAIPIIKQQDPEFPDTASNIALWVAAGVNWLFDGTYVLHEAPLNSPLGTDFAADMATGKGVMMRYLDYATSKIGLNFESFIRASAQAVLATKGSDNQLAFRWNNTTDTKIGTDEPKVEAYQRQNPDDRFNPSVHSAGLDALNAAIPYLGK